MKWQPLLLIAACSGCAPASFVAGQPSLPIAANAPGVAANLEGVNAGIGHYVFRVTLSARSDARVVRATLSHGTSALDRCDVLAEACDALDPRFTTGVTANVASNGPRVFLTFPAYGTEQALGHSTHLLLDVELAGGHRLLDLDLSREQAFRATDWGIGGALRYRAPGFGTRHFGRELSGELGVDRWFSATRLRVSYEIGFAGCRGTRAERERCQAHDAVLPFGFGLTATQYLRLNPSVTFGLGLGYEGVAVLGRFRSPSDHTVRADPFLHGPRFALSLTRSAPLVPRFAPDAPKNSSGFEFSLEVLGRAGFEQPVVIPALGYSYTFAF